MILIYGKGKTGKSVYNFCKKNGIKALIVDDNDYNPKILKNISKVVISPGVPFFHQVYKDAKKQKIPVISDIEFAYDFYKGKIVAITGTDGKTTTSSLIYEILKNEALDVYIGGNYGIPFIDTVEKSTEKTITVLELSSFQLYSTKNFRPDIALILNIDTDHLDWHKKRKHYFLSKLKITKNQKEEDYLIIKNDLKNCIKSKAKIIEVSINKYLKGDSLKIDNLEINLDKIKLKGTHNIENIIFASITSKIIGVKNKTIKETLENFKPLEHRLEFVAKINGVSFYNDAKSTTVQATKTALNSFDKGVILILGGIDKGGDFSQLNPLLEKKAKAVIIIGRDKEKIKKQLNFKNIYMMDNLEKAVKYAFEKALPDGTVLFSPACASFDMFKNYQDRGNQFKLAVGKINAEI